MRRDETQCKRCTCGESYRSERKTWIETETGYRLVTVGGENDA